MGRRTIVSLGLCVGAMVASAQACSLFVSLDGLTGGISSDGGSLDGALDAAPDHDALASDANPSDSSTDASADGADADPCTGRPGPAMVAVNDFCIDSTEVTNKQYADFLAAVGSSAPAASQPAVCAWNTDLRPSSACSSQRVDPVLNPNLPVGCVDWCDAYAYCAWAGKRLCGKVGGGGVPFNTPSNPAGQWMTACTARATRTFPYGNTYQPGACNTPERDAGHVLPVATSPGCVGGLPGIYDMAGNVQEWVDCCEDKQQGGDNDRCLEIGDSYGYSNATPAGQCAVQGDSDQRNVASYDSVGFRCCTP